MLRIRLDSVYKQITTCHKCPLGQVVDGRAMCGHDGKEVKFFDPSYACPKGLWMQETIYMIGLSPEEPGKIKAPVPVTPAMLARKKKRAWWVGVTAAFEDVASGVKEKVLLGAQALEVMTSGRATDEEIATRRASCAACPVRTVNGKGQSFCGACGCGQNAKAELDNKVTYKKCPCELSRPGFYESPPEQPVPSP